jgi:hypothetical protein
MVVGIVQQSRRPADWSRAPHVNAVNGAPSKLHIEAQ